MTTILLYQIVYYNKSNVEFIKEYVIFRMISLIDSNPFSWSEFQNWCYLENQYFSLKKSLLLDTVDGYFCLKDPLENYVFKLFQPYIWEQDEKNYLIPITFIYALKKISESQSSLRWNHPNQVLHIDNVLGWEMRR